MSKVSLDFGGAILKPGFAGVYIPLRFTASATPDWQVNFVNVLAQFLEVIQLEQGHCIHVGAKFDQNDVPQIEGPIITAHKLADDAEEIRNQSLLRIQSLTGEILPAYQSIRSKILGSPQ